MSKAHITWTATALGASFGYYSIERYNELITTNGVSTPGWQRIGKITTEATAAFDDYEGRFTVAESYRVQVYDNFGGPSVPVAATLLTKTITASQGFTMVSNENPAVNQTINVEYPLQVGLPERIQVVPAAGRYGQRLFRSSDQMGETLPLKINLTGATGTALWRTLVTNLRSSLSYICVLDPWGVRWFAGLAPQAVDMQFFTFADLTANLVEVTDTPSIVVT